MLKYDISFFFFAFSLFKQKFKVCLGGSGLNSSRILVGLGEKDLQFFGSIGRDENGAIAQKIIKDSGVDAWYVKFSHAYQ